MAMSPNQMATHVLRKTAVTFAPTTTPTHPIHAATSQNKGQYSRTGRSTTGIRTAATWCGLAADGVAATGAVFNPDNPVEPFPSSAKIKEPARPHRGGEEGVVRCGVLTNSLEQPSEQSTHVKWPCVVVGHTKELRSHGTVGCFRKKHSGHEGRVAQAQWARRPCSASAVVPPIEKARSARTLCLDVELVVLLYMRVGATVVYMRVGATVVARRNQKTGTRHRMQWVRGCELTDVSGDAA